MVIQEIHLQLLWEYVNIHSTSITLVVINKIKIDSSIFRINKFIQLIGKNTGEGYRQGQLTDRKQIFNQKTGQFIKIDTSTGKFMSSKDTPYKGIRRIKWLILNIEEVGYKNWNYKIQSQHLV